MSDYGITCIGVVAVIGFVCLIDISANIARGWAERKCCCKKEKNSAPDA